MSNNEDDDINALFERVAGHFEGSAEGAKGMFSMLVKTALNYRDILIRSSGLPLTVAETRSALGVFMEVLKTHRIPKVLDRRVHDLVILWLEELRMRVHH